MGGLILLLGYLGAKLAQKARFPMVTGFILVGVLLSPSVTGIITEEVLKASSLVVDFTLSIVAFLIGGSLNLLRLRGFGRQIGIITFLQALFATLFVALLIYSLGPRFLELSSYELLAMSLILGAVSAATAPAATLSIVHEVKAKGVFTRFLLAIVAIDDALCVAFFVLVLFFLEVIGGSGLSVATLSLPLLELLSSVGLGLLFTGIPYIVKERVRTAEEVLTVTLGTVTLLTGVSKVVGADPLIANMVLGFIVENFVSYEEMFSVLEYVENAIFAIFFTIAGAKFDLSLIVGSLPLMALLTVGRFTGKYFGSYVGGYISKAPKSITNYMGLALLPQAGVTVGLMLYASLEPAFSGFIDVAFNAVLASIIVNELLAPPLAKYALVKSGEVLISK